VLRIARRVEIAQGERVLIAGAHGIGKPGFLVTDETLDTLEEEARKLAMKLFEEELKDTVIINIGRPETRSQLFTRVLYLIKDPDGHSFKPDLGVAFSSMA
jgi:putative ATP-binding cassette transporter